jgi:hypothetical protein
MRIIGRALTFFGVLGLVTLGLYAFMGTADDSSVWQIAFSGFLIVLGIILMLVGTKKLALPEGYVLVAKDLALPMGGWAVVRERGFLRGDDALTAAFLQEATPDLDDPKALANYAADVATKMRAALVTHERVTVGEATDAVLMQMQMAESAVAQVLVPRNGVTQIIAITNPDLAQAAETARWVVAKLLDLRKQRPSP